MRGYCSLHGLGVGRGCWLLKKTTAPFKKKYPRGGPVLFGCHCCVRLRRGDQGIHGFETMLACRPTPNLPMGVPFGFPLKPQSRGTLKDGHAQFALIEGKVNGKLLADFGTKANSSSLATCSRKPFFTNKSAKTKKQLRPTNRSSLHQRLQQLPRFPFLSTIVLGAGRKTVGSYPYLQAAGA